MKTQTQFRTATEYKAYIREILNRCMGEEIDPSSAEGVQLHECLSQHPHWDEKRGEEAAAYSIRRDYRSRGPQVFLVFEDHETMDISWLKACATTFRRKPIDPEAVQRAAVSDAARAAIRGQIEAFKKRKRRAKGGWKSELSGERISDPRLAHVDHDPVSFKSLLAAFVDERFLGNWMEISIRDAEGAAGGCRFSDEETERSWQQFHAANAVLRVITARENLSKARTPERATSDSLQKAA